MKLDAERYLERLSKRERFDGIVFDPPTAANVGRRFWSVRKRQAALVKACLGRLNRGEGGPEQRSNTIVLRHLRDRWMRSEKKPVPCTAMEPGERGYFVSTVGRDETVIREYIRSHEAEDRRVDQLGLL